MRGIAFEDNLTYSTSYLIAAKLRARHGCELEKLLGC